MALSEHEQQMLDEMERRLYQSEADVVKPGTSRKLNYRSLVLGVIVALVGVGALIGGVSMQQLWLGVIGFIVMLGGVLLAFGRSSVDEAAMPSAADTQAARAQARETLSERMERRWDERMGGDR